MMMIVATTTFETTSASAAMSAAWLIVFAERTGETAAASEGHLTSFVFFVFVESSGVDLRRVFGLRLLASSVLGLWLFWLGTRRLSGLDVLGLSPEALATEGEDRMVFKAGNKVPEGIGRRV